MCPAGAPASQPRTPGSRTSAAARCARTTWAAGRLGFDWMPSRPAAISSERTSPSRQNLIGTRIGLSPAGTMVRSLDGLECLAVVLQEDVARLDAEEVGDAVGHDGQDRDAVVGRRGGRAARARPGEGGVAQRQQPRRSRSLGSRRAEAGEHRARGGVADHRARRARRQGGDQRLDRHARQRRRGKHDQVLHTLQVRQERRQSLAGQGLRRRGPVGLMAGEGRTRSSRDAPSSSLVQAPSLPEPGDLDPDRDRPRAGRCRPSDASSRRASRPGPRRRGGPSGPPPASRACRRRLDTAGPARSGTRPIDRGGRSAGCAARRAAGPPPECCLALAARRVIRSSSRWSWPASSASRRRWSGSGAGAVGRRGRRAGRGRGRPPSGPRRRGAGPGGPGPAPAAARVSESDVNERSKSRGVLRAAGALVDRRGGRPVLHGLGELPLRHPGWSRGCCSSRRCRGGPPPVP